MTNKSTLKSRFLAAKRKVEAEEKKLDAGLPNTYRAACSKLCDAQREMEAAGR